MPVPARSSKRRWLIVPAIALLVGLASIAGAATRDDEQRIRRIAVAGDRVEIGAAIGNQLGQSIRRLHPIFLTLAIGMTGQTRAEIDRRIAKIAEHLHEDDIAEMKAIARGAGVDYEHVLLLNLFYTLTSRHTIGCRQFVAWGEATAGGALLHARNLDWVDYPGKPLHREHTIVDVTPEDGHRHVLLTWPGLTGAITGANERGLIVAYNQLPGGNRVGRLAEPTFFVLRRVLRTCADLESAIAAFTKVRPLDDGSIMLSSSKEKAAAVVEIIDGRVGVRRAPDGEPMLGNANHCTAEADVKGNSHVPQFRATWPTVDVASQHRGKLDATGLRRVMADRRVLQSINILSAVFEPEANRMWIAVRTHHAARGTFVEYPMFPDADGGSNN